MIRILYIGMTMFTAAIILMACSSESYPGLEYEKTENNNEAPDNDDMSQTPIRVFVNEQSFYSLSASPAGSRQDDATRGVGAFQVENDQDIEKQLAEGTLSDEDKLRMDLKYQKTRFYIYAFRGKIWESKGNSELQYITEPTDFRHYNYAEENVPSNASYDKHHEDCLVDGYDYGYGMPASLEGDEDTETGLFALDTKMNKELNEHTKLHYPDQGDIGFNFFGYSIGEQTTDETSTLKWGTPVREADRVYYKDIEIDGSQDLLAGYTPPLRYVLDTRYEKQRKELTTSEVDMIRWIDGYCTFAAHRGIDPQIDMRHQLARFQFRAYPGDESASNTTINSVYIHCHNKGDFVVAHRDTTQVGFYPDESQSGDVYLREKPVIVYDAEGKAVGLTEGPIHDTKGKTDEEIDPKEMWRVYWDDSYWIPGSDGAKGKVPLTQRGNPLILGDNLLVPESETVEIYIDSSYKLGSADGKSFVSRYTVKASDLVNADPAREKYYLDEKYFEETGEKRYVFKKGYFYTITLAVYGLQAIQVYANVDNWQQGDENIIIDEDYDPDMEFYD